MLADVRVLARDAKEAAAALARKASACPLRTGLRPATKVQATDVDDDQGDEHDDSVEIKRIEVPEPNAAAPPDLC